MENQSINHAPRPPRLEDRPRRRHDHRDDRPPLAPDPNAEQAALPQIREAFALGRLSYSKARSLTRVASAANEAELLSIASAGTAHHVDKLTRLYRKVTGEQERQAALRQQQQRYLKMRTDAEGMLVVRMNGSCLSSGR